MQGRLRVFLDANVLFSAAFLPRGNAPKLLELAAVGACALLTSEQALEEARRNLIRKSPPRTLGRLSAVQRACAVVPEADTALVAWALAQGLPTKDAPILAAAAHARADLLVTGDRKHFGPFFGRSLRDVLVLSLADGLAAVLAAADHP